MRPDERIDTELRAWLARQDPPRPADHVVDAVLAQVSVANQGRRQSAWLTLGTVAAAAVIAAVGVSSGILTTRGPAGGPSLAPLPSPGARLPTGGIVIDMDGRRLFDELRAVAGTPGDVWVQVLSGIPLDVLGIRRIDPATNRVTASVDDTLGMAFRGRELWVLKGPCCDPGTLTLLDAASGAFVAEIPEVVGYDLVIDGETAWVTDGHAGAVRRVDLATGQLVASVGVTEPETELSWPIIGDGAVWVAGEGEVIKIDATTNRVVARIPAVAPGTPPRPDGGGNGIDIAFADGAIWARPARTRELLRIDAASAVVTDAYDIGDWSGGIEASGDRLWVAVPGGIAEFDTATGTLGELQRLPWASWYEIGVIGDELWVSVSESQSVVRFPMPD